MESDGWARCPQGLIAATVTRERRRRRRKVELASALVVALLVVAIGIGWQLLPDGSPPLGGLTCRQAADLMPAYLRGELGRGQVTRVDQHLHDCPGCRERMRRLRNGRSGQRPLVRSGVALAAILPAR